MVEAASRDVAASRATEISRIDLRLFSYPMDGVGPGGIDLPGAKGSRARLAVRIETKDGAVGAYVGGQANSLAQAATCAKAVIGKDCFAREQAYEDIRRHLRKEDRMGAGVIDCALWDLAGQRLGVSVAQLLGGARRSVKAYASTWFGGDGGGLATPEAYADFAEECYAMGYRAFKMHGWSDGGIEKDIGAVLALGKRVGGRMALMHDSACSFKTFADALAVGRACDEAGFYWYEDPYSDGGLSAHAHRRLRELIKTPILLGEHVRGLESLATLVLADGTDFVRADPDEDRPFRRGLGARRGAARAWPSASALHGGDPQHQFLRAFNGGAVARQFQRAGLYLRLFRRPRRRERRRHFPCPGGSRTWCDL
jgi:L-alanine-DL-glutamate epimerase-like enolase superfamily enzyme